jgi:hypothetical protein
MSNKKLFLSDTETEIIDKSKLIRRGNYGGVQDTEITILCHETGEVLFKGLKNKVILAGADFTAAKHFDFIPSIVTPTYNQVLKLDNYDQSTPYTGNGYRPEYKICLFAVGIGGCGTEASQVYKVDKSKWITADNLVPFRYPLVASDLNSSLRDTYFGRQAIDTTRVAYNFKGFDSTPTFHRQYTDGTIIDENIYTSERTDDIECYMELKMSVLKEDCRDFFKATTGLDTAKINTLSLLYAYPITIDGYTYYQDIRPATQLNFGNEALIDLTKGIDIIYHIYY